MRNDLNSGDRKQLLENFSAKIAMAYAFRLIGPITRFDLDLIRFIRNEFAHSRMPLTFQTAEVKAVCDHLRIVDFPGSLTPYGPLHRAPESELAVLTDKTQPKTRFICACHTISYRMIAAKDYPQAGDTVFPNDEPLP